MSTHRPLGLILACALLAACTAPSPDPVPAHGVIGVRDAHLQANYWIRREPTADRTVLDANAIAAQNERLKQLDPSVFDLEKLPATLDRARVVKWIEDMSSRPAVPMYDDNGRELEAATLDALVAGAAVGAVPESQGARFGLVVRRADLRTFPSRLRAFNSPDNADIDRFQESALFPGTPVVVAHESRDGQWWFVVSPLYAAWLEKHTVALGSRNDVLSYTRKEPYLVVTGAMAQTVYTRERPGVSEVQLEMGVRVPVLTDWPADRPVNGQHPYAAHVIELPVRADDGSLQFSPALLPRTADVAQDYLPLNRANVLRQSFKFLGERYGWGHSYNARDCSGFVSEVYRSFDVRLPRNTRDQAVSPALNRVSFTAENSAAERLAVLGQLEVGDLVYIPGHVMLVIGYDGGEPYVIHDTTGITYRRDDGATRRVQLNAVSVTQLLPLLGDDRPMVDRVTHILKIRP